MENAIVVKDLYKTFTTKATEGSGNNKLFNRSEKITRNVINGVSFNIGKGEVFGIIGRNGSGKSTILKMISMIMKPDSGVIDINGKVASILELGMGFHQDLSGRENIFIKGSMYGFTKQQMDNKVDDIIKYAELEDYEDLPIRIYSSGMVSRLAFAIMINVDADIMILDEILSTGDLSFSKKSRAHFSNMKSEGKTIIIVSHSIGTIRDMCDRVAWIDDGKVREIGRPNVVCGHYETELAESLEVISELAEAGVPASQNSLGCIYRDGINVEKNIEVARQWFERAAKYGNDDAKINLADLMVAEGKPEEYDVILELYMSAARKGNRDARLKLSRILTQEKSDISNKIVEDFVELLPSANPTIYYEYADLIMKSSWNNEERLKALEWYEKSAELGNINAMYQIAIMYRDGRGPKPDNAKFIEWLKKAAERGHVLSQLTLGNMYRDGNKVESDEAEAFMWYEMAAKKNNIDAIYQVAIMCREGKGTEINKDESDRWLRLYSEHDLFRQINILADSFSHCKNGVYDPQRGMKWYSVNAEHGIADSKYQMGMMLIEEGENTEERIVEAYNLFYSAAEDGHTNSAVQLSNMYGTDLVDEIALDKAIETMDNLAKGGNPWVANTIGNMYANGNVVNANGEKAIYYLEIAATSGLSGAINKLGEMYRDGTLVEQNIEKAVGWFKKGIIAGNPWSAISLINIHAADNVSKDTFDEALRGLKEMGRKGNAFAMRTLGNYFLNGIVVDSNPVEALYWYGMASKFGDLPSTHSLGLMYRDGNGIEKNTAEALSYFKFASERGYIHSMLETIRLNDASIDEETSNAALTSLEQRGNAGNVTASRWLGDLHLEGKFIPKDTEKAKYWFQKAMNLGDAHSRNRLKSLEQA